MTETPSISGELPLSESATRLPLYSELLVILCHLYRYYPKRFAVLKEVQTSFDRAKVKVDAGKIRRLVKMGLVGTRIVELGNGKGDLVPTTTYEITEKGMNIAAEHYKGIGLARPTFPFDR